MVDDSQTRLLRDAQNGIRSLVERDLRAFWLSLDLSRPEAARDALLAFTPALVEQYGEQAAAVAADWYDDVRAAERVRGRFRAEMVTPGEQEAVEGTVRRLAGDLFTDDPSPMLAGLLAAAPKFALAGSRLTVVRSTERDPQAAGWQRVIRGGACRFCRMLHGRGAVYKESTVNFAAHKACDCAAAPSWDPNAPEVDVRLYEASRRMTALRQRAAAGDRSAQRQIRDHNALIQRALDEYAPE